MLDENLTTCLDIDSGDLVQIPVDAADLTLQVLDRRGYRGTKRLICPLCWAGVDAAPNTAVPVLVRVHPGRRPHFAHPAGRAPRTGQHSIEALDQLGARASALTTCSVIATANGPAGLARAERPTETRSAPQRPGAALGAGCGRCGVPGDGLRRWCGASRSGR